MKKKMANLIFCIRKGDGKMKIMKDTQREGAKHYNKVSSDWEYSNIEVNKSVYAKLPEVFAIQ